MKMSDPARVGFCVATHIRRQAAHGGEGVGVGVGVGGLGEQVPPRLHTPGVSVTAEPNLTQMEEEKQKRGIVCIS
jgi:hypothetical protein